MPNHISEEINTKNSLTKLWKSIHPDGRLSSEASNFVLGLGNKSKGYIADILELAGTYSMLGNRKTSGLSQVNKAITIVNAGPKEVKKEKKRVDDYWKCKRDLHQEFGMRL